MIRYNTVNCNTTCICICQILQEHAYISLLWVCINKIKKPWSRCCHYVDFSPLHFRRAALGCALLHWVPNQKCPLAFFVSCLKLIFKLPFSCYKYRSMCMICQSTDYIKHFDTCFMVWEVNYRWSKAINHNFWSFIFCDRN